MPDIIELLRIAKERSASDLHLVVGCPPLARVDGSLEYLDGYDIVSPDHVRQAFDALTTEEQRKEFERTLELDFGYELPDVGRLRCNAARQRGSISFALRILPPTIPSIDGLELPQVCKELALRHSGLVIVSGPTGAGKTTTLAAMVNHINAHRTCHVVTIEDPIEYTHANRRSAITQRQLGTDTLSYTAALRHVLRQDPDVILVGEMRDFDTAAAVLTVAETGHLVLTTGHATGTAQALERVMGLFPPSQRYLAQIRLSSLLIGVLGQTLVPRATGTGRIAAVEVMLGTPAVKNLIRDGKIHQLHNVIRTSQQAGMLTLDQSLAELYIKGVITGETLARYCRHREEVEDIIGHIPIPHR